MSFEKNSQRNIWENDVSCMRVYLQHPDWSCSHTKSGTMTLMIKDQTLSERFVASSLNFLICHAGRWRVGLQEQLCTGCLVMQRRE